MIIKKLYIFLILIACQFSILRSMEEEKEEKEKDIFSFLNSKNNNKNFTKDWENILNGVISFEPLMNCNDYQLNILYDSLNENKKNEFDNNTQITDIIKKLNKVPLKEILFSEKFNDFFSKKTIKFFKKEKKDLHLLFYCNNNILEKEEKELIDFLLAEAQDPLDILIKNLLKVPLANLLNYRHYTNCNFNKFLNNVIINYLNNKLNGNNNEKNEEELIPLLLMCRSLGGYDNNPEQETWDKMYEDMIRKYKDKIIKLLLSLSDLEIISMWNIMGNGLEEILNDIEGNLLFQDKVNISIGSNRAQKEDYIKLFFFGNMDIELHKEHDEKIIEKYLVDFLKIFDLTGLIEIDKDNISSKKINIDFLQENFKQKLKNQNVFSEKEIENKQEQIEKVCNIINFTVEQIENEFNKNKKGEKN